MPLILARERDPGLAELDLRDLDADGAALVCARIEATGVLDAVRTDAARGSSARRRPWARPDSMASGASC